MADATTEFFERLSGLGYVPALARTTGSVRFELDNEAGPTRRLVSIRRGALTVADGDTDAKADCVVRMSHALFDDLAAGRANAMASLLRGAIQLEGDRILVIRFQRLFPAPVARKATNGARSTGRRRG